MCREERHRDTEIYWAGVTLILPQSLPLADIAAPFHRNGFEVSIANPAEYAEVEALARVADRDEIFERLTAHLLSWFVDENPAGPGFLVVARSSSDQAVVGHFLFYANTLLIAGRDGGVEACPSYLYVHLYVAPAFRRLGVFAAMFAFGQTVLARMGVRFAYTVPNPRSSPGFVKFGVPLLGALPVRMAPAWASWEALVRFAAPGNAGVDVERTQVFDGDMVKAAGTRPTTAVRGARTVDLLAWRFLRRPGYELRHLARASPRHSSRLRGDARADDPDAPRPRDLRSGARPPGCRVGRTDRAPCSARHHRGGGPRDAAGRAPRAGVPPRTAPRGARARARPPAAAARRSIRRRTGTPRLHERPSASPSVGVDAV